ncbi:MAG: GAF domain-containing protein [Pseudomonadota bacterium]
MNTPLLADIRRCLEGAIPAIMATCGPDGTPNVAYISQVFYVNERQVALSFQFFNKTRQNILANPLASVLVMDPVTASFYRLHIRYLRTEMQGPVFEAMRAQLAGIASHSGMASVFKLLGSDIYEVREIERVPGSGTLPEPPPRASVLTALRRGSERLVRCASLDELLGAALAAMGDVLDTRHAMVLMFDAAAGRLYTVASCGYPESGVGSEIALGDGIIGVAARERTPVRIMHMTTAYLYSHAIRSSLGAEANSLLETDIPYPGLAEPHSQLAVPILSGTRLLGVLFAESPADLKFSFEDEDLLVTLAGQLGATLELMQLRPETEPEPSASAPGRAAQASQADQDDQTAQPSKAGANVLQLRHFKVNDSVFINGNYLIKGVAGAIFWKLAKDYCAQGRVDFSNRELRLDPALRLPDVADNLEARLLLLQRRLIEHSPDLRIVKTGRGRFRFNVERPLELAEVDA